MAGLPRCLYGLLQKAGDSVMMSLLFELGASLFDSVLGVYFMTKYNKYKRKSFWPILAILIFFGVTLIGDYCAENFSWLITFSLISTQHSSVSLLYRYFWQF